MADDDFKPIRLFISSTKKKHVAESYSWGIGRACSDRFVMGEAVAGYQGDVDCKSCQGSLDG